VKDTKCCAEDTKDCSIASRKWLEKHNDKYYSGGYWQGGEDGIGSSWTDLYKTKKYCMMKSRGNNCTRLFHWGNLHR